MSVTELVHSLTHIVGGTPVQQGRFQFQAGILQNGFQFCGGTLIAPNVVMTAAHCAEVTATDVVLGCEDINDLSQCEVIPVVDSSVFENFDIESFVQGDIQLLVLESDSVQQPITLAAPGFDLNPGQDLTVIGWGAVDFSTQQSSGGILLEALVESTSQESCNQQYKDLVGFMFPEILNLFPGEIINDFKMCSVGDSKGSCQGDSGGPIFMRCDATGEDVQLGIVSVGLGCAYDGMPTVYTTVFHPDAFKFIENVVISQGHSLKTIGSTSEFCVVGGTQPPEQISDPPTPFPTFDLATWTCNSDFFATGDGCDCNCGIPDPDCEYDTLNVLNCQPGQICVEGVCFGDENSPTSAPSTNNNVPPEWFCPHEFFADLICDCNCGAPDPDCEDVTATVYDCESNEICVDNVCVPPPTSFPSKPPIDIPTYPPTAYPSDKPTNFPSVSPTTSPTVIPTFSPTISPSNYPTLSPSNSSLSGNSDYDDESVNNIGDDYFRSPLSVMALLMVLVITIILVLTIYHKCCRKITSGVEPGIMEEIKVKQQDGPVTETTEKRLCQI